MAKKQIADSAAGTRPKTAARHQRRQSSRSAGENRPATLAAAVEVGGHAMEDAPEAPSVALVPVPETSVENDAAPTTTDEPAERAEGPSAPQPEGADGVTASAAGAGRRPASTKRAMLIGMLERAEGASVAELGQRLGWLPHTVRAAITGLRHAGREVTRSKDANGQSIYRLVRVETGGR